MSAEVETRGEEWVKISDGKFIMQNVGGKEVRFKPASAQPPNSDMGDDAFRCYPGPGLMDWGVAGTPVWARCMNMRAAGQRNDIIVHEYT